MTPDRLNPSGDLRNFVAGARRAAETSNWYAAIALALTLPDICAAVDDPGKGKSGSRYAKWWDEYVSNRYWVKPDPGEDWQAHTYLPGADAFSLRCAYLHSGTDEIDNKDRLMHRARFMMPPSGSFGLHEPSRTLTLGVERFVEVVCLGVEKWLADRQNDEQATERLKGLVGLIPSAMTVVNYRKHEVDRRCQSAKAAGKAEALAEMARVMAEIEQHANADGNTMSDVWRLSAMWSQLQRWVRDTGRSAKVELRASRDVVGRLD